MEEKTYAKKKATCGGQGVNPHVGWGTENSILLRGKLRGKTAVNSHLEVFFSPQNDKSLLGYIFESIQYKHECVYIVTECTWVLITTPMPIQWP